MSPGEGKPKKPRQSRDMTPKLSVVLVPCSPGVRPPPLRWIAASRVGPPLVSPRRVGEAKGRSCEGGVWLTGVGGWVLCGSCAARLSGHAGMPVGLVHTLFACLGGSRLTGALGDALRRNGIEGSLTRSGVSVGPSDGGVVRLPNVRGIHLYYEGKDPPV